MYTLYVHYVNIIYLHLCIMHYAFYIHLKYVIYLYLCVYVCVRVLFNIYITKDIHIYIYIYIYNTLIILS